MVILSMILSLLLYTVSFGITPEALIKGSLAVESVDIVGENVLINLNHSNVVQVFNMKDNITKSLFRTQLAASMAATNDFFFSMKSDTLLKFEINTGALIETISLDSLYGNSNYELYHFDKNNIIISNNESISIINPNTYSIINFTPFDNRYSQSETDRSTFYNGSRFIHINSNMDLEHYDFELTENVHYFVFRNNTFIYSQVINNEFYVFSYNVETKSKNQLNVGYLQGVEIINDKIALLSGSSVVIVNSDLDIIKTIVVDIDFAYSSIKKFDSSNVILVNRLSYSSYKLDLNTEKAELFIDPINNINDFSISNDGMYLFLSYFDFESNEKYRIYDYNEMKILANGDIGYNKFTPILYVENIGFVFQGESEELYTLNPTNGFKKELFIRNDSGIDIFSVADDEILISKDNKLFIYNLYSKNMIDSIVIENDITEILYNKNYYILGSKEKGLHRFQLTTINRLTKDLKTIGIKHSLERAEGFGPNNIVTQRYLYSVENGFSNESLLFIYQLDDIYIQSKRFEFANINALEAINETTLLFAKREPFRLEKYVFDENDGFNYRVEDTMFVDPIYTGLYSSSTPKTGTIIKMVIKDDHLIYTSGGLSSLRRIELNNSISEVSLNYQLNQIEFKSLLDSGAELKIYDYMGNLINVESKQDFNSFYSQLSENKLYIVNIIEKGQVKFFKFFK